MIQFPCGHCGVRLKVPETHAGKKGQCPKCKATIRVPSSPGPQPAARPKTILPSSGIDARQLDARLFDMPQPAVKQEPREDRREAEAQTRLEVATVRDEIAERRFPWPIDILLYPANVAGASTLGIVVGIPALMTFLIWFGGPLAMIAVIPFFLVDLLIGVYAAWYSAECVYDSAKGGVRAPMAIDHTGDMVSRVLNLAAVYILFLGPAAIYWIFRQQIDAVFWGLIAWAVVFFPMGLLAMVIQDGSSALNPFGLLLAILRTLVPYVGLLIVIGLLAILRLLIAAWLRGEALSYLGWFLGTFGEVVTTYLGLVMAHLLGRFYWRHADRLDWDF